MVPILRLVLIHIWVACIAGAVLTAGLAMGHVSLATFVVAGVVGLAVGVPAALLNWIYLRPNRAAEIGWTWPIAGIVRALGYRRPGAPRPRAISVRP